MSSRDIGDLAEDIRSKAIVHRQLCKADGFDLLIYCTKRSNEEQAALYASGRTAPGKIVTNARPGESAHNPDEDDKAHAYDAVPIVNGKPVWGHSSKEDAAVWHKAGKFGEEAGLVWSGRWTGKLKEMCHWQDPNWSKP